MKNKVLLYILLATVILAIGFFFFYNDNPTDKKTLNIDQILNAKIPDLLEVGQNELRYYRLKNGELEETYGDDVVHFGSYWYLSLKKENVVYGDFNNDGNADLATVFLGGGGGSGAFSYLVVFLNEDSEPKYLTSTYLGDRIEINDITYDNGVFLVDMITQGPGEPFCCGTTRMVFKYKLNNPSLEEINME